MHAKTPKLLEDLRDAAAFIMQVTQGKALTDYQSDRLLRQAVERNFEIIGEAMMRLARDDQAVAAQLGPYQQVIAFRNVLIHGYDLIDDSQVWRVIAHDLPTLETSVRQVQTVGQAE